MPQTLLRRYGYQAGRTGPGNASRVKPPVWRWFGAVAAVALYAISISGFIYNSTSPVTMANHELVRKTYAVLAFALLGFTLERSAFRRVHGVLAAGIALALYSYAIEIGQIVIDRSTETFADHAFDVASGLAGGALGAFAALVAVGRGRRAEAVALAIVFALLAWGFTLTYGRMP
ncbi:MAG TPA: hypothetical protein VHV78_13845 [Gemmatimonadaceae bacterium]|nr:hypothetical protein [Gemmatimonadaceae bacterium]